MATMGRYCKAYPLTKMEEWPQWSEKRKSVQEHNSKEDSSTLASDYVFIQENYTVTAGIFIDEDILFDEVTPEWQEFCENTLGFRLPERQKKAAAADIN